MRAPRVRPAAGRLSDVLTSSGRVDVLALPVRTAGSALKPSSGTREAARLLGFDLDRTLNIERVKAKAGEVTRVPWAPTAGSAPVDRVVLIGVGDGSVQATRIAAAALARALRGQDRLVTTLGVGRRDQAAALVEGLVLGSYTPPRSGVGQSPPVPLRRVDVVGRVSSEGLADGSARAEATVMARDLANTPSSTKSPSWMVGRARRVAAEVGLTITVREGRHLQEEGFGGILAVGAAAARGPRLVELAHRPQDASGLPHVVLVGKGITFDSGGLSLKPRESMVGMKTDMTGAGVVLAVLRGCARLALPVRVTGLMPLAENAIGAASYRPSDVITHFGGRTVEVRNTDAEGRLVLADALAYADAMLDPDVVVDIATLTGAATASLGRGHAALFTDDDALASDLTLAGSSSGEHVWRMPLVEDYRPLIDSEIADLCHISTQPTMGAGAVIAALFLREFAGARRWAHLDIAGPGRSERDAGLLNRGGTGFGARLLLDWLATLR